MRNPKEPYCAFKDDRERRLALIARDVRFTAVVLIVALAPNASWPDWLDKLGRIFSM